MKMKKQNHKDSNSQTSVHYANVATAYNQAFFHEDNSDYIKYNIRKNNSVIVEESKKLAK